ncbi:TfuA-like protein [Archangium sp.]|uniref:TfuA-like protein n=1 Tax=Archangium sp. TaxID=1872627 RepID=UPI002D715BE3|nr:TfuA-like protein [Archangium sp.]HYO52704.1 TfuA-like protein [Archangium sp.]
MIYVFVGPTLHAEEGRRELEAVFLPPAAQGDVYRAALERPRAIGLVDGYFDGVPSVWHKEILWAMAEGIPVFGSASMGALRAAELASFGMEGVGTVFEAFHRGELTDDDEVAMAHAPEEDGFRPLSEALVNMRATLAGAEREGVVDTPVRGALEQLAKGLYYPERSWPALLGRAVDSGLPPEPLRRLRDWLPRGRVDQKRADALAMLRRMREYMAAHPEPKQVSYTLAQTDAWAEARRCAGRLEPDNHEESASEPLPREALLEELRVGGLLPRVSGGALARALALEEVRQRGGEVELEGVRRVCEAFRREHGLGELHQFKQWLVAQRIAEPLRFFRDEAWVRQTEMLHATEVERCLPDHLRSLGVYGPLLDRAYRKARMLSRAGLERPGLEEAGLDEEALWRWYFTERLARPVPPQLERYARGAGFASVDELRRAALREHCFLRLEEERARGEGEE